MSSKRLHVTQYLLIGFVVLQLLTGCAGTPQADRLLSNLSQDLSRPVELVDVSFSPQRAYQCGPAALSSVLQASGVEVTATELVPKIYIPGRRGSLQVEIMAATRRYGRIPYVLRPQLDVLLREVQAGNPVLVFQNLGLSWYPKWHYAVVVGFDLSNNRILLRSGVDKRHINSFQVFEQTWQRAGHWAMVAMLPGELPATVEELPYLQTVIGLERLDRWSAAAKAYLAALDHWPNSIGAAMGLGNSNYRMQKYEVAARHFQQVLNKYHDYAPAHNNLAQTYVEMGMLLVARQHALKAVQAGTITDQPIYQATLDEITSHMRRLQNQE